MPTYVQIAKRVREIGGGHVAPCHIAHVKSDHGLTRGRSPNRYDPIHRVKPCPDSKRAYIEQALRELGAI